MQSRLRMKRNCIYVDDPHIQSQAALVLLTHELNRENLKKYLAFRDEFLSKHELVCFYCDKKNLKREIEDNTSKEQLKTLATIDHLIPVSEGGSVYDERNCVVSCFPCNAKKGNKSWESILEWI